MLVKDLIEKLKTLPQDVPIVDYFGELGEISTEPNFTNVVLFRYKTTGNYADYVESNKDIPSWKKGDTAINWECPEPAILLWWSRL